MEQSRLLNDRFRKVTNSKTDSKWVTEKLPSNYYPFVKSCALLFLLIRQQMTFKRRELKTQFCCHENVARRKRWRTHTSHIHIKKLRISRPPVF